VGFVGENESRPGKALTNSAALLQHGKILEIRHKTLLPTYDVFDEDRYFEPARENLPVEFQGRKIGITICEDLWNDEDFWPERLYRPNPARSLTEAGAELILNISASPWNLGKNKTRAAMLQSLSGKIGRPIFYCNAVGGNDELIFDGQSLAFGSKGELLVEGNLFEADFVRVSTSSPPISFSPETSDEEHIHQALVLGLRDYIEKCGFKSAVLGLSGGIDSAVVACLAAKALGPENVRGVSLPSQYSSRGSLDDARELALNLGISYDVLPIEPIFGSALNQLKPLFQNLPEDTTEENIQARIRGLLLMAMSNKFGSMVLTTGNKSELAVGYCTLYGDMCGGLAVISDLPKTMVYRLARFINRDREIIPDSSIQKPPSAELRPDQTDQDSLPPYDILDAILNEYIVNTRSTQEIVAMGFSEEVVRKIVRLIDVTEYKRRQAAPGLRITTKAFGVGRRIPIAQRYRE